MSREVSSEKRPRGGKRAGAGRMNNWRRHREDAANLKAIHAWLDPYASGISFTGWIVGQRFSCPTGYTPLPVSPAKTGLLRVEWKRYGLIDATEQPGPFRW
ncbi:MAG TPA: hypothetical protein VIU61_00725 [Kofleriaceae bacterium]